MKRGGKKRLGEDDEKKRNKENESELTSQHKPLSFQILSVSTNITQPVNEKKAQGEGTKKG